MDCLWIVMEVPGWFPLTSAGRRHPSKMAPFTFPWPWGWDKWDKRPWYDINWKCGNPWTWLPPSGVPDPHPSSDTSWHTGRAGLVYNGLTIHHHLPSDLVVVQWEATPQFSRKRRFMTFLSQISKATNICPGLAVLRQLTNQYKSYDYCIPIGIISRIYLMLTDSIPKLNTSCVPNCPNFA